MLFRMFFSSSILILTTTVLRKIWGRYLPGRLYVSLWGLALLRLILPVELPIDFIPSYSLKNSHQITFSTQKNNSDVIFAGIIIWTLGTLLFLILFFVKYYKEYILLAQALPYNEEPTAISNQISKRKVQICVSDRIMTPVTYGVIKPRIVLPKNINYANSELIQHIILHESVHIRWMDNLLKFVAFLILGFYWFNPFMWLLCYYLSKDIEIACDQNVMNHLGSQNKKRYIQSLYQMAEHCSENFLSFSSFGKNPIIERVDRIMKYKKNKIIIFISVSILTISTLGVFAAERNFTVNDEIIYDFSDGVNKNPKDSPSHSSNVRSDTDEIYISDNNAIINNNDSDITNKDVNDTSEVSNYNLNRKYREWYPELTDEEVLEIEKLHEYNRKYIQEITGRVIEAPQN